MGYNRMRVPDDPGRPSHCGLPPESPTAERWSPDHDQRFKQIFHLSARIKIFTKLSYFASKHQDIHRNKNLCKN